jgi:hypothetical protein
MMEETVKLKQVEEKILTIHNRKVILDRDVAELYGVETKRVNEAAKNNPDKFPDGYIITLTDEEMQSLRSKFSTLENTGRGKRISQAAGLSFSSLSYDLTLPLSFSSSIFPDDIYRNRHLAAFTKCHVSLVVSCTDANFRHSNLRRISSGRFLIASTIIVHFAI